VDRKLASRVDGIDVILTGHTHDALPEPVIVNDTLVIASGSNGKFVSRVDLDVKDGKVAGYKYRLIPIFSDVITPDAEMAALIDEVRAPFADELTRKIGTTEEPALPPRQLQRHIRRPDLPGAIGGTRRPDRPVARLPLGHECASGPGHHRGGSAQRLCDDLSGGLPLVHDGQMLKDILEDVGDNLFNKDPYYQQGGDMVRVGGMGYTIDPNKGDRRAHLRHDPAATGEAIDPAKDYVVAGWASVNEDTEGPAIWDVVENHLSKNPVVKLPDNQSVKVAG
jgi:sulfur-oxidizing protein SoxB